MKISVSSCFNFVSGYSTLLRCILDKLNVNIKLKSYGTITKDFEHYFDNVKVFKEDLDLFICPPYGNIDQFHHPLFHINPHKNRIMFTMWEATRVSDLFIDHLNSCKAIIVPNEWNKQNFINQGCNVPIEVLPLFVDGCFTPIKKTNSDKFIFGCSNGDARKNLDRIISTFSNAFENTNKNVLLKIKTSNHDLFNRRILSNNIDIIKCDFTKSQLKEWYSNNNVYVSGVTAEGWGFMQLESLSCGTPILGQKYSALGMYLTPKNNIDVNFTEVKSTGFWENPGAKWSQYDEDDMIDKMRWCYNNPTKLNEMFVDCSEVGNIFTEEKFITNLYLILRKYV